MPEVESNNFQEHNLSGQWYEVQRDSSLTDWACVTQEINFDNSLSWPLTIYHYVNGNKVIEPEQGKIGTDGVGKTKMLSKRKHVSVLSSDLDVDTGYALVYACATDWWMIIPRKTESAWILSRNQTVDDDLYN